MSGKEYMSGYEARICANKPKSAGDLLKDQKMFQNVLREVLTTEVERVLPTGEVVNIPLAKDLLIDKIGYWKENPKDIDIKAISAVLGEAKTEVDVGARVESASDIFKGIGTKVGEKEE